MSMSWYNAFNVKVMGALSRSFLLPLPARLYSFPVFLSSLSCWFWVRTLVSLGKLSPWAEHFTWFSAFGCLVQAGPNPMKNEAQLSLQDVLKPCTFAPQVRPSLPRISILLFKRLLLFGILIFWLKNTLHPYV